eukprot:767404-Hanusia_phi.AAC.3
MVHGESLELKQIIVARNGVTDKKAPSNSRIWELNDTRDVTYVQLVCKIWIWGRFGDSNTSAAPDPVTSCHGEEHSSDEQLVVYGDGGTITWRVRGESPVLS